MPEPVYINNTQFAALCGVSIPAFSNWKTRFPEFIPDYDLVIGKMGFWKRIYCAKMDRSAQHYSSTNSTSLIGVNLPSKELQLLKRIDFDGWTLIGMAVFFLLLIGMLLGYGLLEDAHPQVIHAVCTNA